MNIKPNTIFLKDNFNKMLNDLSKLQIYSE